MKQLALQLPGLSGANTVAPQLPGLKYQGTTPNLLTTILSDAVQIVFFIAGFLVLIWLVWGVFQYIFAGGDKAGLAKARSRITWAIVGFVFLLMSFVISEFAKELIPTQSVNVPKLSVPVGVNGP